MKHFCFPRRRARKLGPERGYAVSERAYPDPLALFQATKNQALEAGDELLRAITAKLKRGERTQLETTLKGLPFLADVVMTANEATRLLTENRPQPQEIEPEVQTFLVSSLFLANCHAYLTSHPNGHERLHMVTGIKVSPMQRTLERMVKVALASESATGALADQNALQKALIEMDEWGHHLHGLFHSHPGTGARHTQPSQTDLATHRRYEDGGYPLIGVIFLQNGMCRFFSNQPFIINIYGKGVKHIDEDQHIYKIDNPPSNLPH